MEDFMDKSILVIMAAGLGSRFGGIKQLTPVGPSDEIIMEYSIYDAIEAGFKRFLFIIRRDIEKDFKERIGDKLSRYINIEYVFQDIDDLPEGYQRPSERTKPWGTGHAILSCLGKIDAPFAVINADDYYGKDAFIKVHHFLSQIPSSDKPYHFCMAGFVLDNTLSKFGSVTRGVCQVDYSGSLLEIRETHGITEEGRSVYYLDEANNKIYIDPRSRVSMNFWGFTPNFLAELSSRFIKFLDCQNQNQLTGEYLLPDVVEAMLKENLCEVTVLNTSDKWFGITYQEDKDNVRKAFRELVNKGLYPVQLFQ